MVSDRQVFVGAVTKIVKDAELEAYAMNFVRERTSIRVPEVYYAKGNVLVQERVEGLTLAEKLPVPESKHQHVRQQLETIINQLRLTKGEELKRIGKASEISILHNHLDKKGDYVLSHGDFGVMNIMVDDDYNITGVVDWEDAGFYAPWHDYRFIGTDLDFMRGTDKELDEEIDRVVFRTCSGCGTKGIHVHAIGEDVICKGCGEIHQCNLK